MGRVPVCHFLYRPMDQYNDNDNEAIYRRFKDSLSHGSGDFFDEDDIIDIFDTAGDFNDEYVRMEALLYAARYFPESEAMADRRAIFYHSYSDTMRDEYLVDHPELVTFISSLLRLLSVNPSKQQAVESLGKLLDGVSQLEDEELIQLVDAAATLDLYDWLIEKTELLKSKTSYPQTLLYELDIVFENAKRYDVCVKMLEELTMLEPFNGEFWRLLAQAYLELDNLEQAMASVDYALAIDPADEVASVIRAEVLYRTGGADNISSAIAILEPILEKDSTRDDIYQPLALCYITADDKGKLAALLDRIVQDRPGDEWVAGTYMTIRPESASKAIDAYARAGEHTEEDWIKLAEFVGDSNPSAGADLLLKALDHVQLTSGWEVLTQLLFNAGRYRELCDLVQEHEKYPAMRPNFTHRMSMLFVKSLVEAGDRDNAVSYARAWCDSFERENIDDNPAVGLRLQAVTLFMRSIIDDNQPENK